MHTHVYLNGQIVAKEKATVSVLDRGFLFGDGIYEVIPVFGGMMVGVSQHLARLMQNLETIHIPNPHTLAEWEAILQEVLIANQCLNQDAHLYIQVTRGAAATRQHGFPEQLKPTTLVLCGPSLTKPMDTLQHGFSAITMEDKRRTDCTIKAISLLPSILAHQEAHDLGCYEAILIRNGFVTEGTTSNVFIVKNGTLITPNLSPHVLDGVTRSIILSLAKQLSIPHQETPISAEDLIAADEIWLTGSTKEIVPITTLDNQPVGQGKTGTIWFKIMSAYQQHKLTHHTHPKTRESVSLSNES